MIVYKNYYPNDFSALHDGQGIVYKLLNLRDVFVAARIDRLEAENKRKQEQRIAYMHERHLKEKELRRIYVDAYRDRINANAISLKAGDGMFSFSEIASDEKLFEKLTSDPSVTYAYHTLTSYGVRTNQGTVNLPFDEVEKQVNDSLSYKERYETLRNGFISLEDDILVDIRKEDIRSQALSQIMKDINYSSFKEYEELRVPPMIEFLVLHGYIDEDYYDYISYFYGNFIDAHDWDFVLDLKLGKSHPYDFHLNSVEACLKEIPTYAFRKHSILNIYILDYLAEYSSEKMNMKKLLILLQTALKYKKYDFFSIYYQRGTQQDIVFEQLYSMRKDLWKLFEKNDDIKNSLKLSWFKYAENEHSYDESQRWLSTHFDFITENLLDIDEDKWESLIRNGSYEFEALNGGSNRILKIIAQCGAYTLTRHNLEILVGCLLDMKVDSLSYRLVMETENKELIGRIDDGLGQCLQSVFNAPESEKESAAAIIGILLSANASEKEKVAYLSKQQNKIDLEGIEQQGDKSLALKCDVVVVSWESVIHYMNTVSGQKTDDVLTAFVESHANELSEMAIPDDPESNEQMLLKAFVASDTLNLSAYEKILRRFKKWHYAKLPVIQEARVSLMINQGMIRYSNDNNVIMQGNYSDKVFAEYLLKNKKVFLENKASVPYTTGLATILMRSRLTKHEKASIIPFLKREIINVEVANEVISLLTDVQISLELDFLIGVMSLSDITDEKIFVLSYTVEKDSFDDVQIMSALKTLPEPYSNMAYKGKKPELPDTNHVRRLVEALKKRNYISSYSETKNGIRVNTKLK